MFTYQDSQGIGVLENPPKTPNRGGGHETPGDTFIWDWAQTALYPATSDFPKFQPKSQFKILKTHFLKNVE